MFKNKQFLIIVLIVAFGLSFLANFLLFFALKNCMSLIEKTSAAQVSPPAFKPIISPPSGPPPGN
ncbi:MAG: hypothetical protein AB1721_03070 [Patescibacteria group bacterium]